MKKVSLKKKKALKGMTLIEVIIAMVVLVVISAMVAQAASAIVSNVRTSRSVVDKVNYQSGFVAGDRGTTKTNTINIALSQDGSAQVGNDISVDIYEAPEDATARYAGYDKAGNLKYFKNS